MAHLSDTIKHCNEFAEWKDCDKHKDLECYRLECSVCDWTERDCEEDKEVYCGDCLVPIDQCNHKP